MRNDEKQINLDALERARLALSKVKYSDSKILQVKEAAEKLPDNITILIGRNDNEQFNSKLTWFTQAFSLFQIESVWFYLK